MSCLVKFVWHHPIVTLLSDIREICLNALLYICDVQRLLAHGNAHTRQLAALNQNKCTWAPTERHCSPMEAVLVGEWAALPGFAEILKMCPPVWTWVILTRAYTLCTVEGSRLPQQGHTRCVNTCMCFKYLTTQMSWVEEPTQTMCWPFYSQKLHDPLHMQWPVTLLMTSQHRKAMLHLDFYKWH